VVEAVRMALSGVARACSRIRCGKILVAQMLCGSSNKRLEKLHLNRLSTFGLLDRLTQSDVVALLDGLIALGLVEQPQIDSNRPVVQLTPAGTEVMKGTAGLPGDLPIPDELLVKLRKDTSRRRPAPAAPAESSDRKEQRSRGEEMPRPQVERGRAEVREPAVAATRPPAAEAPFDPADNGREEPPWEVYTDEPAAPRSPQRTPPAGSPAAQPSHYWTWRILSAGFPLEECAAIRRIPPEEVLDHALRSLEDGWPARAEWCLSAELIAAMERVFGDGVPEQIRPHLAELPGATYEQAQFFLKCRSQRKGVRSGE
jgi:ATP-dependent DNA helicase RecQ